MVRPNVADKKLIDSQYPLRVRYTEIALSTNIQKLKSFSRHCIMAMAQVATAARTATIILNADYIDMLINR